MTNSFAIFTGIPAMTPVLPETQVAQLAMVDFAMILNGVGMATATEPKTGDATQVPEMPPTRNAASLQRQTDQAVEEAYSFAIDPAQIPVLPFAAPPSFPAPAVSTPVPPFGAARSAHLVASAEPTALQPTEAIIGRPDQTPPIPLSDMPEGLAGWEPVLPGREPAVLPDFTQVAPAVGEKTVTEAKVKASAVGPTEVPLPAAPPGLEKSAAAANPLTIPAVSLMSNPSVQVVAVNTIQQRPLPITAAEFAIRAVTLSSQPAAAPAPVAFSRGQALPTVNPDQFVKSTPVLFKTLAPVPIQTDAAPASTDTPGIATTDQPAEMPNAAQPALAQPGDAPLPVSAANDAEMPAAATATEAPIFSLLIDPVPAAQPNAQPAPPADLASPQPTRQPHPQPVAMADLPSVIVKVAGDVNAPSIDVQLDPVELGSVSITIDAAPTGLIVTVVAERTETLDLMRRHAEQFLADLRQSGFLGASLHFGQSPEGQHQRQPADDAATVAPPLFGNPIDPSPRRTPQPGNGALDLRL
jgi:hypothetical protein